MKNYLLYRNLLVFFVVGINLYSLLEGLMYSSLTGILLAIGSLVALFYSLRILRKMKELDDMSEEEA